MARPSLHDAEQAQADRDLAQRQAQAGNLSLVAEGGNVHYNSSGVWTIAKDSSRDVYDRIRTVLNSSLSAETKDYLVSYMLSEQGAENAFQRSMRASSSQYQRAVEDLRKAGINPFLALQSLSGSSPTSPASSVSGDYYSARKNQSRENAKDIVGKIGSVIAIIAAAVIAAL